MRWEHAIAGTATDAHYANLLAPPALPGAPATLEWGPMVVDWTVAPGARVALLKMTLSGNLKLAHPGRLCRCATSGEQTAATDDAGWRCGEFGAACGKD